MRQSHWRLVLDEGLGRGLTQSELIEGCVARHARLSEFSVLEENLAGTSILTGKGGKQRGENEGLDMPSTA